MSAQDVIADCLKQLRRPGARTTDAGDAAFVTAALAAAGYVVVPREPSERMCGAGIDIIGREFGESDWETARQMAEGLWPQPIYAAMLAAAEAEAKETGDGG